jgi:hypothetical protein
MYVNVNSGNKSPGKAVKLLSFSLILITGVGTFCGYKQIISRWSIIWRLLCLFSLNLEIHSFEGGIDR